MSALLPEAIQSWVGHGIQLLYLVAAVLFMMGIKRLGSPSTARKGNQLASLGMLLGVIVTLFDRQILQFEFILAGIVIGSLIGAVLAKKLK